MLGEEVLDEGGNAEEVVDEVEEEKVLEEGGKAEEGLAR